MRKIIISVALCVSSALSVAQSKIEDLSGNDMYRVCKAGEGSARAFCRTWVSGVLRGAAFQADMDKKKLTYCIPPAATADQILDSFLANMEKYPDNRHLDAVVLLMITMTFSFPCNV